MTGEKGEKVLLTGITGYVANYIADLLLKKGYTVVGTLRNVSKIEEFKERYPQQVVYGQLQFSHVKDIGAAHAFDKVFKDHPDIKYVIHAASPVGFAADDLKRDIIDPAIAGTLSAVTAAHKYGKQVKRFIQTSSIAAMTHPKDEPGTVYTEDSWSKVTLEEGAEDGLLAYYASKKYGEKALWDFMENETPSFDAVSINPPLVLGGHLNKIENPDQVHFVLKPFQQFIDVTDKDYKVPPGPWPTNYYVDVRDLAEFHVLPIENISQIPGNRRYLTTAGYFYNQSILDGSRRRLPKAYAGRIFEGKPGNYTEEEKVHTNKFNNDKTNKVFGLRYSSFEDTASNVMKNLIDIKDLSNQN